MNVSLTEELETFVHHKVASGLFQNASEVVRASLRTMKEADAEREQLNWIRREVDRGWQDAGACAFATESSIQAGFRLPLPMSAPTQDSPLVLNSFPPETLDALRAMNRAYADVVLENHRLGLPVIQWRNGQVVRTPTEELLPQALRYLETNGEPLPEQIGL